MRSVVVPSNLNLDELAKNVSIEGIKGFKKDKVYLVCHCIYTEMAKLSNNYHKYKQKEFYVPLCSVILKKIIGSDYSQVLEWMRHAKIIEIDNQYIVGRVSKAYKLRDKYLGSDFIFKTINKKRGNYPDLFTNRTYPAFHHTASYLRKWFSKGKLKIDKERAFKILEADHLDHLSQCPDNPQKQLNARVSLNVERLKVINFDEGKYNFIMDDFGYRFHTPLTSFKKILRPCITFDGEELVQLDMSNSVLFFTNYLLDYKNIHIKEVNNPKTDKQIIWNGIIPQRKKKKEREEDMVKVENIFIEEIKLIYYRNIKNIQSTIMFLKSHETQYGKGLQNHLFSIKSAKGEIYESLIKILEERNGFPKKITEYRELTDDVDSKKRNYIKKTLLELIFADPKDFRQKHMYDITKPSGKLWKCFYDLYPEIAEVYENLKISNSKDLCKLLQRIESTAIIGHVCTHLKKHYPDIPIFTIHDCLVTTVSNANTVYEVMINQIKQFIGLEPNIKLEKWRDYEKLIPENVRNINLSKEAA